MGQRNTTKQVKLTAETHRLLKQENREDERHTDTIDRCLRDGANIPDTEYVALLNWYMSSDPFPTDPATETVVKDILNEEAEKRGFDGWVEAYHEIELDIS